MEMLDRIWIVAALCVCSSTALADTIVLANGDQLSGEIVEWAVDHVVIEHPQLGRVELSLDQLKLETGKPPSPGLFGTGFLRGWSRELNLGWNGKNGNTDTLNVTAGFDFGYADDWKRWKLAGRWFYDSSDGEASDNYGSLDLRRDWLFPDSRWFAFVAGRYQYDQFESWKHRAALSVGPGLHLLEGEAHSLDGRFGLNFTREWGERGENKGEGLLGFDYTWKIAADHTLTLSNDLFPQFRPSFGEFRNLTTGEWKIHLAERPDLNLKIGVLNEYETDIEEDEKNNDVKYYVAVGLGF